MVQVTLVPRNLTRAWSNGRVSAVKHRVMMKGQKERYSYAVFSIPKEGVLIEVPKELVDKDHPLLYRPFDYLEFLRFSDVNLDIAFDATIDAYAGTNLKSIP
ncbi:Oxoglutarate/iron-dependent dioxygenase [Macleaya cordata]|uniref:Oxoglutarate/iron-dependent dioxygenase n=1 Tax=Macleaya cordata TaxID=56857 RepID=A0A200Q563_MACCD|nr:Oxoglutarate/iron-dependent dioxygenase [Macleaya cordata]